MLDRELRKHLSDSWPDRLQEDFRWTLGPIGDVLPDFAVRRVSPIMPGYPYIYLSVGVFMTDPESMREFFIMSPVESPRHVETLAMVAHFHSFPSHRLMHGSVIDVGRPWLEGVDFQHFLVSWPYALDARAATYINGNSEVIYLWLIPISANEARFVRENGSEPLEEIFEKSEIDLTDISRRSVI